MISAAPIDANGRTVELGDWVRVIQAPLSILGMPSESLSAFSNAIGRTFQVDSIQRNGDLELDLTRKTGEGTIWLEACCTVITRRPQQKSQRMHRVIAATLEADGRHGKSEYRVQP